MRGNLLLISGLTLALALSTGARAEDNDGGKGSGSAQSGSGGGSGSDDKNSSSGQTKTDDSNKSGGSTTDDKSKTNDVGKPEDHGKVNDDTKPDDKGKPGEDRQGEDKANPPAASSPLTGLQRASLQPTALGRTLNAKGEAETRMIGTRQRFKVEIELNAPNGTVFIVAVDGAPAGSIQILNHEGEFEAQSDDGTLLPAALNPVSAIKKVTVLDSNNAAVLERTF